MTPEEAKALGYEELDYPDRKSRRIMPGWMVILSLIVAVLAWTADYRWGWLSLCLLGVWLYRRMWLR